MPQPDSEGGREGEKEGGKKDGKKENASKDGWIEGRQKKAK